MGMGRGRSAAHPHRLFYARHFAHRGGDEDRTREIPVLQTSAFPFGYTAGEPREGIEPSAFRLRNGRSSTELPGQARSLFDTLGATSSEAGRCTALPDAHVVGCIPPTEPHGRIGEARTRDPLIPNQVRYLLRYNPRVDAHGVTRFLNPPAAPTGTASTYNQTVQTPASGAVVEIRGLEPRASSMPSKRSTN